MGVEQGGVSSSDQFQLVNDAELKIANSMGLGLDMGVVSRAAIGLVLSKYVACHFTSVT